MPNNSINRELYSPYAEQLVGLIEKNDFESRHQKTEQLMRVVQQAGLEWSLVVVLANEMLTEKRNRLKN